LTDDIQRWDDVETRCRDATYSLGVYVDHHVYLLAVPDLDESDQENCPSIVFHDNFNLDENDASSTKEAAVLKSTRSFALKEESLQIKEHVSLGNILEAFDAISVSSDLVSYDFVKQNCATFALHMMVALSIEPGHEHAQFVINNLHDKEGLIEMAKSSPHLADVLSRMDISDETDMVELLTTIAEFYVTDHRKNGGKSDADSKSSRRRLEQVSAMMQEEVQRVRKDFEENEDYYLAKLDDRANLVNHGNTVEFPGGNFHRRVIPTADHSRRLPKKKKREGRRGDKGSIGKGKKQDDAGVTANCELEVPPLGSVYNFAVRINTSGSDTDTEKGHRKGRRLNMKIGCSDGDVVGEPIQKSWFNPFETNFEEPTLFCPCENDPNEPAGIQWVGPGPNNNGDFCFLQAVVCPGDQRVVADIVSDDPNLLQIVIGGVDCLGSLVDIEASSPSGNLYTSDLDGSRGDERFVWNFNGATDGAFFKAGCHDVVCPTTLPDEDFVDVYGDPKLESFSCAFSIGVDCGDDGYYDDDGYDDDDDDLV
jgi:hypothetical protein